MSAKYPSSIATDADLKVAKDRIQTTLRWSIGASDTVFPVADATNIVANMLLTIDAEIVSVTSVTGNDLTVVRGFDNTAVVAHSTGCTISAYITAWHHNQMTAEVKAIEQALGPNLSNVASVPAFVLSTGYDFPPQSPGGSLTGGIQNVITLAPVPLGVNGTDTNHYLYISGGVGAAEAVLITGGTAVGGTASGTLIFTPANGHSGAWTIRSASAGIKEAMCSVSGPVSVLTPVGRQAIYKRIVIDKDSVRWWGAGTGGVNADGGDPPSGSLGGAVLDWRGPPYEDVIRIEPVANDVRKDIDIRFFNIDGIGSGSMCGEGIWAKAITGCRIEDVHMWAPAPATNSGALYLSSGDGGAGTNKNVNTNVFRNITIRTWGAALRPDAVPLGACIYFDRGTNLASDVSQNIFENIYMYYAGTAGIYGYAYDSNRFVNIYGADLLGGSIPTFYVPAAAPIHGGSIFYSFTGIYKSDATGVGLDTIFFNGDNPVGGGDINLTDGDSTQVFSKGNIIGSEQTLFRGPNSLLRQVFGGPTTFSEPIKGGPLRLALLTPSAAIANTAAETAFNKVYTIPANTLWAGGSVVRVRAAGRYSTTGTPNLTLKIRLGGNIISGVLSLTANNASSYGWSAEADAIVLTSGAGGTARGGFAVTNVLGVASYGPVYSVSFALNTTIARDVDITAQWGAADPANTITLETMTVEILHSAAVL